MKATMLKLAGVKSEAAFYKKYPTQEAFMKVHGKAFKKAQVGTYIGGETKTASPINFKDAYDNVDLSITGKTNDIRQEEAYKQASLAAQQKQGSGGGGFLDSITPMLGKLAESGMGDAKYGKSVPIAQDGYYQNNNPYFMNNPGSITNNFQVANEGPIGSNLTPAGLQSIPNANMTTGSLPNNITAPKIPGTMDKIGAAVGKYAGPVGEVLQGYKALRAERQAVKGAQQMQQVSDLALKASRTKPEQTQRKYVRPEDMITAGNQLSPTYGTGTNILAKNGKKLKKGGEIQNTYAPGTLYDDLGYEPLNEVKQYQNGGTPWGMIGDTASNIGGAIVGQDAGSQIGGTIGGTIGNAFGPLGGAIGKTLGTVAGGLLDKNDKKLKKAQAATNRNMSGMAFNSSVQGLQGQNASYMEDGGYVSNDWNPQVITKFGDHSPEDVYHFAHEGMDTLRAGGHLKSYKDPSEKALQTYAMGGELQTHWGGHMEEMSENPYLPDGGVTYMPHGQSHDETNGKGQSGIGITYGDNPVEVERKEPIMKLRDGSTGEDNLVVFGNLEIPKYGVDVLGDKKAKGMKFKNYIADLSKSETKQNKIVDKSTDELSSFDAIDSFDKLKLSALKANVLGGNMKLKDIADTKNKAAALQNAINDTAEEMGVDADHLAKGKVKTAKFGGKFTTAAYGTTTTSETTLPPTELDNVNIPVKKIDYMRRALVNNLVPAQNDLRKMTTGDVTDYVQPSDYADSDVVSEAQAQVQSEESNPWIKAANSLIPMFRPTDAEGLNQNQLLGEMYAMSQNQVEPVQAQQYSPELTSPYSVSLQDQMNEITAQTRAAQKMSQGNPAAQAMIAAQAYDAINKVKGEEFRMNQSIADKAYGENRAAMNDAKLKNLGILDQQYTRQAQAKSNTKAITQAALNSISDKYAKNALENRTLKTYENMYNYRYDANSKLINMNPLAEFNNPTVGNTSKTKDASGNDLLPVYDKSGDIVKYMVKEEPKAKTKSRNGSIVKAIKNL